MVAASIIIGIASALVLASLGRSRISLAQLTSRRGETVKRQGAHRLRKIAEAGYKGKHWATGETPSGFSFGAIAHVSFRWLFEGSRPADGISLDKERELHSWHAQEARIARLTGQHRTSGVLASA